MGHRVFRCLGWGARMGARFARGAIAGIGILTAMFLTVAVRAEEPPRPDATIVESSARVRLAWTEFAFRGDRPKGWDEIVAPEFRTSLRILAGLFEAKFEAIVQADRFAHFQEIDVDLLRGEVQLGVNTGAWSYLLEWKSRNIFEPGYDEFITGQNAYAVRLRHRFAATVFESLPPGLFQASVAAGYVAATPHLLARNFSELELEWVQRFGDGFAIMIAPKLELADYRHFPGEREDAVFSLKLVPSYSFGGGLTLSLEGQALIAFSTLDTKTGEAWELTPILRLQKAL